MGKNLIVSSEIVHNRWITSSGAASTSSYCMSTGFIPVESDALYSVSYWQPANSYTGNARAWTQRFCFYDASKTYISGYISTYNEHEYFTYSATAPANAAYVRTTFQIPAGLGTTVASSIQQAWTIDSDYKWQLEKGYPTGWKPSREDGGGAEMIAYGQFTLSNMDGGIEYIVGTQTAATGSWTGVSEDAALVTGKTISYKLPYAGSGNASLTLTLADGTNTDAIAVYLNTTRVTTHFGAGSVIQMTYDGTYWRATAIPNSNNYDRINHANSVKAATAITAARVIAGNSSGYNNVAAGIVHDISYPILYAPSAITTTGTTTYEAYPSVNFSSTHAIEGGVAYSTLFLVGTVSGKDFTIVDPVFTCNTPTTEDGKYYIPLGLLYSATNGYFSPVKELWCYKIVGKDDNGQDIGMFGSLATISEYLAISAQEEADKAVAGNLETDARLTVYKSSLDNTNSELTSVKSKVEAFDGEFADYKDTVSSALSQQADSLTATFNRQVESMNEVLTNNSQVLEQLETYIRASTSGLELGASNSSIKAVLSNDRLSFMDGDTEVAYISNNNFYITAGTVTQSIQVGEHKWLAKSTGHMTLVWVKE